MADIKDQLIKDSYNYVLQSDTSTGVVYRIGGSIPVNPIFSSGLTINSGFTYSNGTEQNGYALLTDGTGYAYWGPISGASPSSGVTSITVGDGLSANSSTGAVIITNIAPDQTVIITGGTNIEIIGAYPNFGVNFTGSTSTSGDYLPLSGGTVTGDTIFQSGLTATTISATTYQNLPETFLRNQTNSGSTDTIHQYQSIFNPSNLTVQSTSTFVVEINADYYVLGDLTNYGTIQNDGTLKIGGVLYNYGIITGTGIIE